MQTEFDDNDNDDRGAFLPTPEYIRQRCLEIQSRWSDEVRAERWIVNAPIGKLPPGYGDSEAA